MRRRQRWSRCWPRPPRSFIPRGHATGQAGDALYFVADGGTHVFARISAVTPLPADPAKDPDRPDLTWLELNPLATAPLEIGVVEGPLPAEPDFARARRGAWRHSRRGQGRRAARRLRSAKRRCSHRWSAPTRRRRVLAFHASAGTFGKTAPALSSTALIGTNPVYGTNASGKIIITNTTNGPYFTRTEATWADSGTLPARYRRKLRIPRPRG